MKKFLVLYHMSPDAMEQASKMSPEEIEKEMGLWMQWAAKCDRHLLDLGTPLTNGQRLAAEGQSINSDKNVAGYSVLQAVDMQQAKKLLQGHPHLAKNAECSIEVHEKMPLPG